MEKLSTKLENWFQITFNEFLKELEKGKVKLTLSQKAEWEDYFLQESGKALSVKKQIDSTDKEIDHMVYQLYGLTDEEIAVVEGALPTGAEINASYEIKEEMRMAAEPGAKK